MRSAATLLVMTTEDRKILMKNSKEEPNECEVRKTQLLPVWKSLVLIFHHK